MYISSACLEKNKFCCPKLCLPSLITVVVDPLKLAFVVTSACLFSHDNPICQASINVDISLLLLKGRPFFEKCLLYLGIGGRGRGRRLRAPLKKPFSACLTEEEREGQKLFTFQKGLP